MTNTHVTTTRGNGLLENFLARQRSAMADRLIPEAARSGRLLDIGCGTFPFFLQSVRFAQKYGIDQVASSEAIHLEANGLNISNLDVSKEKQFPFADNFFDVISMLAVFEHLDPSRLSGILAEIYRVLKPGGVYIMTTPAPWTHHLLRLLARCNLVSREEIEEHKGAYSHESIAGFLEKGGFKRSGMGFGRFEAGMNLWATAKKI
jgi:SAM-dependent methyltransferase